MRHTEVRDSVKIWADNGEKAGFMGENPEEHASGPPSPLRSPSFKYGPGYGTGCLYTLSVNKIIITMEISISAVRRGNKYLSIPDLYNYITCKS